MEHADENNAAPWEDVRELAEEFCKSEYCSWAINCSFIWLDFKRLHALLCFVPLTKSYFGRRRYFLVKTGVPILWDLMLNDLRWNRCNNNRNKMHNKCNVHLIILKLSSPTPGPWKNCPP